MTTTSSMQDRLVFLIGPPRSGSTLLMRILNATSQIYSRPEPHLLTPLAHLGFWRTVDDAPFDHLQAQMAVRSFVDDLPGGQTNYYTACRAYTDHLYSQMLQTASGQPRYFLDKTPANGLILPFLTQLYPKAHYIVLTRHPAAIFCSYANSFFDGDYAAAVKHNPILSRYVPALATFLRDKPAPILHVSYEGLVADPESTLASICAFLDIPNEPDAVNYDQVDVDGKGLGDPIGVGQHSRPVTSSVGKWAAELAQSTDKFDVVAKQLAGVDSDDLTVWGYPTQTLWDPMAAVDQAQAAVSKKTWNRYASRRKLLVWLRRDIHNKWLGRLLKKIRFVCNVLLRG